MIRQVSLPIRPSRLQPGGGHQRIELHIQSARRRFLRCVQLPQHTARFRQSAPDVSSTDPQPGTLAPRKAAGAWYESPVPFAAGHGYEQTTTAFAPPARRSSPEPGMMRCGSPAVNGCVIDKGMGRHIRVADGRVRYHYRRIRHHQLSICGSAHQIAITNDALRRCSRMHTARRVGLAPMRSLRIADFTERADSRGPS